MKAKKHTNFWFKWELQNEIFDRFRDRIFEGRRINRNDIQVILEKYNSETSSSYKSETSSSYKSETSSSIKRKSNLKQRKNPSFGDFCWGLGVWILINSGELNELCDFLVQMSGIQLELKEESLLELTLVSIKANQLKEALERLETYIPLVPFSKNSILIGYAGLISYILWSREPSMLRYRRTAIEFLQSSIQIDHHNNYFLIYLVKLMSENEECLVELEEFLTSLNISSNNYYFLKALYETNRKLNKPVLTWIQILYQLCLINPVIDIDLLLELADAVCQYGELSTGLSLEKIVELMAIRIEHDKSNILVWKRMVEFIPLLS